MKTLKELVEEQEDIERSIYELASSKGLSSSDLLPITDGVACPEQYLNAKYQIMCILKEPYDEISEEGVPSGGGWSIVNECFKGYGPDGMETKYNVWRQTTWQPLIYFLYALFHGMYWQDLNWLRDQPEMAKVLQDIAFLNVSKMPALTTSYYKAMEEHIP